MYKQRIIENFDLAIKAAENLDKLINQWIVNNEREPLEFLLNNYSLSSSQVSRIETYLLASKLANIPDNLL